MRELAPNGVACHDYGKQQVRRCLVCEDENEDKDLLTVSLFWFRS